MDVTGNVRRASSFSILFTGRVMHHAHTDTHTHTHTMSCRCRVRVSRHVEMCDEFVRRLVFRFVGPVLRRADLISHEFTRPSSPQLSQSPTIPRATRLVRHPIYWLHLKSEAGRGDFDSRLLSKFPNSPDHSNDTDTICLHRHRFVTSYPA